jgi:YidC/Oxa1 family membrane protein insertase
MQTQRTILWVIFTMSLLFLWDAWQRHQGQPSMFGGSAPASTQTAPAPAAGAASGVPPRNDASVPQAGVPAPTSGPAAVPGTTAAATPAGAPPVRLSNDVLSIDVDPQGGEIQRAELLKFTDAADAKRNVVLFDEKPGHIYLAQTGLVGPVGSNLPNHRTPFVIEPGARELAPGESAVSIRMSAEQGGVRLVRTYTLKRGSYVVDVTNEITNVGTDPVSPTLYMQLTRDTHRPPGENQFYSTFVGPVVYSDKDKFQKVDFSDIEKNKAEHNRGGSDGWVGIIQHYFVSAWVPTPGASRTFETAKVDTNLYTVRIRQGLDTIAPGASVKVGSTLYVGPQDQGVLETIAPGLDLTVDYGWLTVIAKPLFWLLQALHGIVQNWGWAIVLLTIVVKLAFFPLQAASYRSMAKMKKVTPKLMQLRERYGDDRVKLNQAMMELYKTEKINPLGGCLPIVVQIPVFIALYWVLLASVEMRNAPWIGWIKDLAAPDTLFGTIPWINMPIGLLPLLMAVTMFIQTKLNPTPPDPLQAKLMLWMPLIFSVMFFFFPAGLVLYWLVNNLFSIAQQWVITRRIEGKPVFGRAPA